MDSSCGGIRGAPTRTSEGSTWAASIRGARGSPQDNREGKTGMGASTSGATEEAMGVELHGEHRQGHLQGTTRAGHVQVGRM